MENLKSLLTIYGIIFFITIFSNDGFSQKVAFQKIYQGDRSEEGTKVFPTTDKGYIQFISQNKVEGSASVNHRKVLMKTDKLGNIEWTRTSQNYSSFIGVYNYKSNSPNNFIRLISSSQKDRKYLEVEALDLEGNLIFRKTLNDKRRTAYKAVATLDGGVLISCVSEKKLMLLKLNDLGEIEWDQVFFAFGEVRYASTIKPFELPNGDFMIGWNKNIKLNPTVYQAYISRINKKGETLYTTELNFKNSNKIIDLVVFEDSVALIYNYQSNSRIGLLKEDGIVNQMVIIPRMYRSRSILFNENKEIVVLVSSQPLKSSIVSKYNLQGNKIWGIYLNGRGHLMNHSLDKGYVITGFFQKGDMVKDSDATLIKIMESNFTSNENPIVEKEFYQEDEIIDQEEVFFPKVEVKDIFINVYPNPFQGRATFQIENFTGKEDFQLFVFDNNGKQVASQQHQSTKIEVDFSFLPNGIYFYKMLSESRLIFSGKIIKQ